MHTLPSMVDMRLTREDTQDYLPTANCSPAYPYGLSIRLSEKELDKLGLTIKDFTVDDLIHLQGMAVVTSTSENQRQDGEYSCCVEIQITHLSEENEEEETDTKPKRDLSKLYK